MLCRGVRSSPDMLGPRCLETLDVVKILIDAGNRAEPDWALAEYFTRTPSSSPRPSSPP